MACKKKLLAIRTPEWTFIGLPDEKGNGLREYKTIKTSKLPPQSPRESYAREVSNFYRSKPKPIDNQIVFQPFPKSSDIFSLFKS